jgi:glutaredoxin
MVMHKSPVLRFYTRAGCHLCEEARATLQQLLEERAASGHTAPPVREVDVDADSGARRRFFDTIPVLELGNRRLLLATGRRAIARFLAETLPVQTG